MWLEFEGFFDLIKEWWEETQPLGFASYVIASKLKYIKANLKVWNREIFGDIRVKKSMLLERINSLDLKEEPLSSEDLVLRSDYKVEWAKISCLEEISWRQKSRALWLRAGGRNTKFFHRVANLHRKFNTISAIEVDGIRLVSLPEMKSAICGFYKAVYTEAETWRPLTDGLPLNQLCVVDRDDLELPFTEEEV